MRHAMAGGGGSGHSHVRRSPSTRTAGGVGRGEEIDCTTINGNLTTITVSRCTDGVTGGPFQADQHHRPRARRDGRLGERQHDDDLGAGITVPGKAKGAVCIGNTGTITALKARKAS